MTELFPTYRDLVSAAQRIASHRDALAQNLPGLKASVADCQQEIDQANQLMVAVDRLGEAHARFLDCAQAAGPSLRALLEVAPVVETATAPTTARQSGEDPAPVETDRAGVDPGMKVTASAQRVLDVLRNGVGNDGICRMTLTEIAEASGVKHGTLRVNIMPALKKQGLAEARPIDGSWFYYVATLDETPAPAEAAPAKDPAIAPPASEADEIEAVADLELPVASTPAIAPTTRTASSRDVDQGREILSILRKAPTASDGAALFEGAAIAKRLGMTDLRLEQVLDHLEEVGSIELRSCTLKGHFRAAVLPVAS